MEAPAQEDRREDAAARPEEEEEADRELEDALRELADARREEESRRERGREGEHGAEGRSRLEEMAYTPGFNPVADSNVLAERENAQRMREDGERQAREERERELRDEDERERLRLAAVENRTYMIGRASVDILSDDLVAFRVLREHAVPARGGPGGREDAERGEENSDTDDAERQGAGEYSGFSDPELVIVTEQAVCTTEQQAVAFAFMQDIDTGRAAVFNRHASSFAGETLRRLVENEHTALRTVETVDRALYPYSFGRPSDRLIAALRVVVLLFADADSGEGDKDKGGDADKDKDNSKGGGGKGDGDKARTRARRLLTRESVTVIDMAVEREVQAESEEKEARRERRNRSFVDGPSHRRQDAPLTPLRHVNSVQVAIDMTGEGDTRRKEEQFRTASP